MATAELKVRIEAEIRDLQKGLNNANKDLNTFSGKVATDLKRTATEAAKASVALGGVVAKGSNQAAFALTNLGRVAQDAPFGFIGIQNNLNPLLESFQRLKQETGGTGSALKALGSSLIGAGGIGFALSAVSAGILFYQQYLQKANKTTQEATKSNENYTDSLDQVTNAQVVGAKSAVQETTTLSFLFKQYQNGELTLQRRKAAYEELQRLYPAYFGNIDFEQKASVKTKDAYDRLTSSIIATARARAATDLITKNSQRQLENEQKVIDLGIELTKAQTKADKARAINLASIGTAGQEGTGSVVNTIAESKALKSVEFIRSQINNIKTDSNLLSEKNLQLEKSINAEIVKGAVLTGSVGGTEDPKEKTDKQEFARGKQISIQRLNSLDTFLAKYKATEAEINKTPLIGFPSDINTKLAAPLNNLKLNILPQLQGSFQTFFDDVLMRGKLSFDTLGKSILNTFASVLANQATTGILALLGDKDSKEKGNIFATVLKGSKKGGGLLALLGIGGKVAAGAGATGGAAATGGTAALATGTAATGGLLLPILGGIAAVAGIASLFKKRKAEPQPAFTTSNAISTSSSSNVDFGNGRVVFEISGVNLVGVLNRAGAKLQRFGP